MWWLGHSSEGLPPHDHGCNCLFIINPCSDTLVGVVTLNRLVKGFRQGLPSLFFNWPWSALPYSSRGTCLCRRCCCRCCRLRSKRAAPATMTIMRIGWWMSLTYLTYIHSQIGALSLQALPGKCHKNSHFKTSDNFAEWLDYQLENDWGSGLAWGIKSLDHPQHPRGTRHRVNPARVCIFSIASTLQSPSLREPGWLFPDTRFAWLPVNAWLWECLTACCKAFSLANGKGMGTNDWVIRSLDD